MLITLIDPVYRMLHFVILYIIVIIIIIIIINLYSALCKKLTYRVCHKKQVQKSTLETVLLCYTPICFQPFARNLTSFVVAVF